MGLEEAENDMSNRTGQESGAVPVAAGAGDSNICGGIIQLHWDHILDQCVDINDQVRQAAIKVGVQGVFQLTGHQYLSKNSFLACCFEKGF